MAITTTNVSQRSSTYGYETARIPLVGELKNRQASSSKDQIFYNVVFDVLKNPYTDVKNIFCTKRGGFEEHLTVVSGGGVARAIAYWPLTNKIYSVIDNKLYSNTTEIATLSTSSGTCWFCETTGTANVLVLCDGSSLYIISTSDTVTLLTDPDIPANPISPISIDGYLVVAKGNTDEIYNSDVDNPVAWDPTNFLSAEMYPDRIQLLTRHLNYFVAFGTTSTEFFYDNANESGSPFRRHESIALEIGLAARDSVARVDRQLLFVGQAIGYSPCVYALNGVSIEKISTEFQDRILVAEGSNIANATGWTCRHKGHTLYVLNLSNRTLVYDITEKMWCDWSINSSGNHAVLPFKFVTGGNNNELFLLHNSNGKIYKLSETANSDFAGPILVHLTTSLIDFGNTRQKRMFRFELVHDRQSSGTCTVEWSDDDYQTWSAPRTLDLTGRAFTKAGGIFRRRAFRIKHESNAPFRAESIELDYSDGIH